MYEFLSKEASNREIDGTLKRLGTDYLDLYIIHRFDYGTPIEETMSALDGLVKSGKVRALGASAMYGYRFYNMQLCAKENGLTYLDDAVGAFDVKLSGEDVAYIDEVYVPHKITRGYSAVIDDKNKYFA